MIKQLTVSFLITLCSFSPAYAVNWELLGHIESDGRPFYLDTDSIEGENGYYQFWASNPDKKKNLVLTRYSIACRERLVKMTIIRKYASNGRLISSYQYGNNQEPEPILVGSMLSLAWEAVCGR